MLKKSKDHEVWFHVMNGKKVGLLARVPELLRLDLISIGEDFELFRFKQVVISYKFGTLY